MSFTPLEQGLGSILLAIMTGIFGHYLGGKKTVRDDTCCERRNACFTLLLQKMESLAKEINNLKEIVNGKLLGL
jgi:hypothetical protein